MKKLLLLSVLTLILSSSLKAQLSITKMIGKDADKYKLGYCVFAFYDFPLTEEGNRSLRLELMDLAFFPGKQYNDTVQMSFGPALGTVSMAYLSIKLGYKYIFSEDQTGFYIEPSAGWARVIESDDGDATYGDGIALALETGYSLEVGQRGHVLNFGLKYENDRGGPSYTISSLGFRVSYAFNMFRKKGY
jgi:hypothetical protein